MKIQFCALCGAPTHRIIPPDDSRVRDVCTNPNCGEIFYQNPKIVGGTITTYQGKVLLCKRAIEPRRGYWTLPAGFMELAETASEGAARETLEEAGATIKIGRLYVALDVPHVSQVHLFYLAELLDPNFTPGEESLEAALFELNDIPWYKLAFPTVVKALRHYVNDLGQSVAVYEDAARWPPKPKD